MKKRLILIVVVITILFGVVVGINVVNELSRAKKYEEAIQKLENGKISLAYAIFCELEDYEQSEEFLQNIIVKPTFCSGGLADEFYYYDNDGNCLKYVSGNRQIEYTYNSLGFLVLENSFWDGKWSSKIRYSYDSQNNCIYEEYSWSNIKDEYCTNTYNEENLLIEKYSSRYETTTEYEYDKNNNCIKKTCQYSYGRKEITEYEYNDKMERVKSVYTIYPSDNNEPERYITQYYYDNNGNCIKEKLASPSGNIETRYEYDIYGQKIKITHFYGTDDEQITPREYKYCFFYKGMTEGKNDFPSSNSGNSNLSEKTSQVCVECGKEAKYSYTNPFSNNKESYCYTHYKQIVDILGKMESDVGKSSQSKHTCEKCSREGTHKYDSFTGQTEYYCTKHYEELKSMLEAFGLN